MADIVGRLRRFVTGCDRPECQRMVFTPQVCEEAAAEIERLRAALQDIADGLGETDLAEVGRYAKHIARAALETREAGVSAKPLEGK